MYKNYGIKTSKFDLINQLPDVKKEALWLNYCKAECLQTTFDNLDSAFKGFYNGAGYPKFKSKHSKQSFHQKQNFKILKDSNKIVFLKNEIKFMCSESYSERLRTLKIKHITYSKDSLDQYFASILVEDNTDMRLPVSKNEIGVDLGLKTFIVTSNGEFVDNPRFFRKSEKKLSRAQRKLSRKLKGSKNKNKQRLKVARIHKKISNQREYFLHQVSNKLISENQVISLETLNVAGMIKNRKLSKSIQDAGWSRLGTMLTYKGDWRGRDIRRIGTFKPSSKTCSECGWINQELTLADRVFDCKQCGHKEDRDQNAAKNVLNFSREELPRINASGEQALATRRKKKTIQL